MCIDLLLILWYSSFGALLEDGGIVLFLLDGLHSCLDVFLRPLNDLRCFLYLIDPLEALCLKVFVRKDALLELLDGHLDLVEALQDLLHVKESRIMPAQLGLHLLNCSLHVLYLGSWRRLVQLLYCYFYGIFRLSKVYF